MNSAKIHIAYAISSKGGTSYRARAYVLDNGVKHSIVVGIGDTANDAMGDAVKHIEKMYAAEGLVAPTSINFRGRMSASLVDALAF